MTKKEFREWTAGQVVILDGATGSNLQKRGMPPGVCPEAWITDHPEVMLRLQQEYVEAGTNILYAPTFTANRIKLAEYHLEDEMESLIRRLAAISKEAAGERAYVAGDLTMTGEQLSPVGPLDFEELVDIYKEQIRCLCDSGVDLLVVETMMSLQETRAALLAAKETCDLPVMATMTFNPDGRTFYGTDPATAMVVLQSLGADAVGVNCSAGPDTMLDFVRQMKEYARVPIIAKPNAGLPHADEEGQTVYDMESEEFTGFMEQIVLAGATIVGGCCGTTPEYIAKLTERVKKLPIQRERPEPLRVLASERQVLQIPLDGRFQIVGERINPTGKKKFQEKLRAGDYEMVRSFAEEQTACGAAILDINVGMNGIDEKETMQRVLEEVTAVTPLPLCLDTSHIDVMETALRRYPGRALINSISLEQEKFEKLLPIARKYGAMFILLPLSDKGLPETLDEKKEIIRTIWGRALSMGFQPEDIVVDGLVATVGANPRAALETLETIRYCREELGLATIVGLSNISFGLPERSFVNTAFLTMAIQAGLTMAIANPSQDLLVNCAAASDLLLNKEGADLHYINRMTAWKATQPETVPASAKPSPGPTPAPSDKDKESAQKHPVLYEDVMKGNRGKVLEHVKQALEEGLLPSDIINRMLIPAIHEVGELFDKQIYFLPQLISSAEVMKKAIDYLEPLLEEDTSAGDKPVIVIATVEGDIHDIGKNLVGLMLKNCGYEVIDLGKDVPKERIAEAAREHKASIIGLSALMTTTMQEMRHVIAYVREQQIEAKVIIGGAVITQSYADEIGADGYSKDAAAAVRLVETLLSE